jgi:hypothetical protein
MTPSVEHMRDHVMGLIEQYDIVCNWVTRTTEARAAYEIEEVWIPKIKSAISYATALHEIGHIRCRHRASRLIMVRERDAWRWAKSHALIWTETMESQRETSLAWYEARINSGSMSPVHPPTIWPNERKGAGR